MSFWSPMLCLSTTTLITRLHNLNNSSSSSLVSATSCTENITRKRAHLWAAKLAAYFLIFLLIFRMFLVSLTKLDCTSGERACMTEHPFWLVNPTILIVVHRYAYVVNASIFQSLCLIGLWVLFLDYYMNFRLNGVLLEATYAVMVANRRHFQQALNSRQFGKTDKPRQADRLWKWIRLPFDYASLGRQIWKKSSECGTESITFPAVSFFLQQPYETFSLQHFYLDIYSKPLRCRLYVYSNACDVLVVVLNTVISK